MKLGDSLVRQLPRLPRGAVLVDRSGQQLLMSSKNATNRFILLTNDYICSLMQSSEIISQETRPMTREDHAQPLLSPAEWEVMKVLWDAEALAARDVFARLPKGRQWAYKTVKTLLSRLVAKGALTYDQIGNSYLYRPAIRREQATRQEVRSVFQRLISEACSPVLAQFIDEAELSDAEIRQLKRQLDEKRKGSTGGKRGGA